MIIDSHVHFYDPHRPEGVPHPSPQRTRLFRTCLPEQLKPLAQPAGVTGVIAIECSPWRSDNLWLLGLAARDDWIRGVVGNLDPLADDFLDWLARCQEHPKFCGLRLRPPYALDYDHPGLIAPLEELARRGLTLDLLVGFKELPNVARLAQRVPALRFMVDHLGHVPIDGENPLGSWRDEMRELAAQLNVSCKLSCLTALAVAQPAPEDLSYYRPTLDFFWETFGPRRLVYGSNWPPCEEHGGYAPQIRLTEAFLSEVSSIDRERVLGRNAEEFYLRFEL